MSNRPNNRRHRRARQRPDELDDVCVFCRLVELVDHIERRAIPALVRGVTDAQRAEAQTHTAAIRGHVEAIQHLLLRDRH